MACPRFAARVIDVNPPPLLTDIMDKRLKAILHKVAAGAALDAADLDVVRAAVGVDVDAEAAAGPQPLWAFLRRQILLNQRWFDFFLDDNVDVVLLDAGAAQEQLPQFAQEYRPFAEVSLEALVRAVRRHLSNEDAMRRAYATRLVGLCRIDELVPLVVDSLASGREERQNWGLPVIAAGLECLALLRHPRARELCRKHLSHGDYQIRRAAAMCLLVDADTPLAKDEVALVLERSQEIRLMEGFAATLKRAVVAGNLVEADLERLLNEFYGRMATMTAFGEMCLVGNPSAERSAQGFRSLFTKMLGHNDPNMRAAAAHAAAFSAHAWAVPLLLGRLGEEDVDQVKMVLVAAIGSFGADDDAFVDDKLASPNPHEQIGAIWSQLGRATLSQKRKDALAALAKDVNFEVRRAASAALAVVDGDAELIELKWCELLNIDDWWPWAVPLKGLVAHGERTARALPRAVQSFLWISDDDVAWSDAEFDRMTAFYRAHPQQLTRWLSQDPTVPASQRTRATRFAGLVGGPVLRHALEQALVASTTATAALEAAQELACLGGARSAFARVKAAIAIGDRAKAGADDMLAVVASCFGGDSNMRRRAATLLKGMGADAEPYLCALVQDVDFTVAQAAADAVAQMHHLADEHLQDIARLLNSDVRSFADLHAPHRLVSARSPKVKQALCELCALVPEREQAAAFLIELAADRDENVAASATAGLATVYPGAPWVSRHVLQSSLSDGWRAREAAFQAMAQVAEPAFLPRLLDVIAGTDEHLKNLAITALERVAEKHVDRGLLVLDIRDAYRVRERYGLDVQVNYDVDQQSEGLRMLLLGLEKRKDSAEVQKHVGRQVMLVPRAAEAATSAAWSKKQFESLALHLKVTYTDEETGSIVAEVVEEATGEVVSALLQSNTVCAITVGWS